MSDAQAEPVTVPCRGALLFSASGGPVQATDGQTIRFLVGPRKGDDPGVLMILQYGDGSEIMSTTIDVFTAKQLSLIFAAAAVEADDPSGF